LKETQENFSRNMEPAFYINAYASGRKILTGVSGSAALGFIVG